MCILLRVLFRNLNIRIHALTEVHDANLLSINEEKLQPSLLDEMYGSGLV